MTLAKRGAAGYLITLVLGLFVIGLMAYGLGTVGYQYAKEKIFGEKLFTTPSGEKGFTPYTPPELSESDKIALDSMNALVCAINAVSAGDTKACTQKDYAVAAANIGNQGTGSVISAHAAEAPDCTALFGQTCVKCNQPMMTGWSQKATLADVGRLVESCAISSNFADNDQYCGKIVQGQLAETITKAQLVDWLKKNARDDVRAKVESDFLIDIRVAPLSPSNGYHICADDDGTNEIYLYDNFDYDNDCKDAYKTWQAGSKGNLFATQCAVKSFMLPQKVEKFGLLSPNTWVAGSNDPDYVAFYQSFPRGMEKFWHVDQISMVSVSLIVGFAAFDVIPVIGKLGKGVYQAFKQSAKEAAELMAEKGVREGLQQFFKGFAQFGWKNAVRKQFVTQFAEGFAHGMDRETAEVLSESLETFFADAAKRRLSREQITDELTQQMELFFRDVRPLPTDPRYLKQMTEEYAQSFGKTVDQLTEDERQQLLSEAVQSYRRQVATEFAEQTADVYSRQLTKGFARELARRTAVKTYFKQMFKEGAEEISKEEVQAGIARTLRKVASLPPNQRRQAVAEGVKLSEEYLTKDGLLDFTKITGKTFADPGSIDRKLTKEFIDAIATEEGQSLATLVRNAGWSTAVGLKRGTLGPHNPLTEPFKFLGDQIPISFSLFGLGTVPKAAAWIRDHKYPIIVALAFFAAAQDAAGEKFESVGPNSLGLMRPYLRGEAKQFVLDPSAIPYNINVKDQEGVIRYGEHLYLVSPCKADLQVQNEICECSRIPVGVQHWSFARGMARSDVSGIVLNNEILNSVDLVHDHFKQIESPNWMLTDPEQDVIANRAAAVQRIIREMRGRAKQYPALMRWADPSSIKTRKDAIAASETARAVQFFDDIVNGIALSNINDNGVFIGIRAEEKPEMIPQRQWQYMAYFYDFSGMQKICSQRDTTSAWISSYKSTYQTVMGQPVSLNDNVYAQTIYKTDCITAGITRDPAYTKSNGANYCIDEYPYLQPVRWTLMAVEVAASIALTALTGGTAAPFLIATTGIISGVTEEWIARQAKWPAYNDEGATGTVPIAQTTLSEAEWSALGGPKQ